MEERSLFAYLILKLLANHRTIAYIEYFTCAVKSFLLRKTYLHMDSYVRMCLMGLPMPMQPLWNVGK